MNEEVWLPTDFDRYLISNFGRLKKGSTVVLKGRREDDVGNIEVHLDTYHMDARSKTGVYVWRRLDHVVINAFKPLPEETYSREVIHLDGDLSNCRADNLEWA